MLLWRNRLVQLFEDEQRGPLWVRNGQLQQRVNSQLYSPHYPIAPVYPGAAVFLQDCAVSAILSVLFQASFLCCCRDRVFSSFYFYFNTIVRFGG